MSSPSDPKKNEHGKPSDQRPQDELKAPVTGDSTAPDNWVERLAQRSTGLPDHEKGSPQQAPRGDNSLWRLAGLGIQFAATVAMFAWMGNALDRRMGWSPWGLVSLSLIAVVGNLYLLIKESFRETTQQDVPKKQQGSQLGESNVSLQHTKERSPPPGRGDAGG